MSTTTKTLSELARAVGGEVLGDGGLVITKVAPIDEAGPGAITFLANPRYAKHLERTRASAVIVGRGAIPAAAKPGPALLKAADPYVAFAKVLQLFHPAPRRRAGVSAGAHVDPEARVAPEATVYPNVFVGRGASVGERTVLFPGVFVGEGVSIGRDCVLHPNVVVREGCRIGDRVVLHAGVVIGADGFGYAGEGEGRVKIPQVGVVEIEDDVEIGANSTIDRATLGRTVIRRGVKIDNLVQIAHNVTVGENSVIAAQAGVAGSTRIGRNVILAGQAGVVNHVVIGDGAKIGPQSGIPRDVPAGAVLSGGIEAAPHRQWLRVMALLPELPALWAAVRALEKKLGRS
ncbi:MAG TPA: UDP-3-O-(3-hydroxymyristoyl)glucosamine N-acyltransferase [candidate division Zixibacteria bacterium]|nr:UDP-3-O-(3-hydroxymyristoyl)glucosamine N-acyltransferase [candidate division Zixibacteria bacterium]